MRRTWAFILIGAAVLASLVAALVLTSRTGAPPAPLAATEEAPPARNPAIILGAPAPMPPSPAPESAPAPAPEPAPQPVAPAATPAPRPAPAAATPAPAAAAGDPLARCEVPAEPAAPLAAAAPSEDELNRFAGAVERYDQQAERYRGCLDGVVRDATLPEGVRSEAVRASNASAARVEALWEAYGAATDRYRAHQAEHARAAAERALSTRPDLP